MGLLSSLLSLFRSVDIATPGVDADDARICGLEGDDEAFASLAKPAAMGA
jgi:hypothetical protein